MAPKAIVTEKLGLHLKQVESGAISESQLSELVQLSRSIIQAHLNFVRSSITHLCLQQGFTVIDLSYDCVAEAFARNTDGTFHNIHNFIKSLQENLNSISDRDLFLAYKSFLTRIAEAQLARLYAQADPTGSHIHRNIRDCLKESKIFLLRKDFRGVVLCPANYDPLEHLGHFPPEELARMFMQEVHANTSIPAMLESVHHVLTAQSQYRRTIPLIDVVQMFKAVFQNDFLPDVSVDHPWSLDGLGDFELQHLRHEVENSLKEKILLTYLVRGKVQGKHARAMFNVLQDVLEEWFSGETHQDSLYSKLNSHLSTSPEVYEEDFRPKMEYLLKTARQELAGRLMKEL